MTSQKVKVLAFAGAFYIFLTGCTGQLVTNFDKAYYWQRASISDAAYMEGPKAQQMLHRDIANCVTELRELERLGTIRTAIPAQLKPGMVPDPRSPQGQLDQWETPEREGALRAELGDYHDFETCMIAKGWERIKNIPYDVAERAKENYTETILRRQYRSGVTGERQTEGTAPKKPGATQGFNE